MKQFVVLLLLFSVFFSCTPVQSPVSDGKDEPISVLEESSSMFPAVGGTYTFKTNEVSHIKPYGLTFWTKTLPDQSPFTILDVSLNKISGNKLAGYGVIFCHGLRQDPPVETMLVLMINLNQEYIIGKVIGDRFSEIIPWTHSDYLFTGFNQENRIEITFNDTTEQFLLQINGSSETTFEDGDAPLHRGGQSGFLSVVSPLDKFPAEPVHVLYTVH